MAYSPRRKSRSTSRRTSARRGYTRRTTRSTAGRARRTTARRRSAGTRTIRIVLEQAPANAVQRPPLGMAQAPTPRKATF